MTSPIIASKNRWLNEYDDLQNSLLALEIEEKNESTFDMLPNEIIHGILDKLRGTLSAKSLRFVNRRWNFIVGSRCKFHPKLSDAHGSLEQLNTFMESGGKKEVARLHVGTLNHIKLTVENLAQLDSVRRIVFEERYSMQAIENVLQILKHSSNVEEIVFKKMEPRLTFFSCKDLCQPEVAQNLGKLKKLTIVKPRDAMYKLYSMDLSFTAYTPLESLELLQTLNTSIRNLDSLPTTLKILEFSSHEVDHEMIRKLTGRLVNLEKLSLQSNATGVPLQQTTKALKVSLEMVQELLNLINLKQFNCIPVQLMTDAKNLREKTKRLSSFGKIVKWWYGGVNNPDFRLRISKKA